MKNNTLITIIAVTCLIIMGFVIYDSSPAVSYRVGKNMEATRLAEEAKLLKQTDVALNKFMSLGRVKVSNKYSFKIHSHNYSSNKERVTVKYTVFSGGVQIGIRNANLKNSGSFIANSRHIVDSLVKSEFKL
jgi:hypothetical protein